MKLKKSIIWIITILILLNINCSLAEAKTKENFAVNARNAIAIDSSTGEVLYEKNAYEIVPMASTTKILTALITIERMDPQEKFIVSKNASSIRGSKVGYKAGDEITVKELLYGLMYRSGNDAAITLAEGMGGSIEGFAEIMNEYSKSLGLLDSHFQSPHGLDMTEHYSSAYDLAILTSKGMEYEVFREIVGTKEISKEKYNFTRDYNNINKILWKIPGANGVKTGYTGQAGKCLVSSIDYNGRDVIIVVLNCPDRWNVTEKIFKYIQETVAFQEDIIDELAKIEIL
jgi:D-alanyl-D-alanine carboxypeptidase